MYQPLCNRNLFQVSDVEHWWTSEHMPLFGVLMPSLKKGVVNLSRAPTHFWMSANTHNFRSLAFCVAVPPICCMVGQPSRWRRRLGQGSRAVSFSQPGKLLLVTACFAKRGTFCLFCRCRLPGRKEHSRHMSVDQIGKSLEWRLWDGMFPWSKEMLVPLQNHRVLASECKPTCNTSSFQGRGWLGGALERPASSHVLN